MPTQKEVNDMHILRRIVLKHEKFDSFWRLRMNDECVR